MARVVSAARWSTRCLVAAAALTLLAAPAHAHSLDSSTISVRIGDDVVTATISLALETLDRALDTDYSARRDLASYADEIVDYLDGHLTVVGPDGRAWPESYADPTRESVEGIQSFSVDVTFDPGHAEPTDFTITFDAVTEAVAGHEAVVVLTDRTGDVSTAGVLDRDRRSLSVGDGGGRVAITDMVEYGVEHVLEGADHLLFLVTLLLPAPLVAAARRWAPRPNRRATVGQVLHVITAFTVGHSCTLILSALGWLEVPARPVEFLIAVSVAVSAVHAMRPLVAKGEQRIAVGFGLIHGLAFAGILTDLGLAGTTSVLALLAFNVGVELSQIVTATVVFPSLYVLSTTRWYPSVRLIGAAFALVAATGWGFERVGLAANPLGPVEGWAIGHRWTVVVALAVVAATAKVADGARDR